MTEITIKPNLFIPGAAKSGTTSLHELLDSHPEICMSSVKEPVFWNTNRFKETDRIIKYNNLFQRKNSKILGESTTSYMYFPEFIENIKNEFTESPKFIFILRNPIDRCYSHYWYLVGRGQEKKNFIDSVKKDFGREYKNYGYVPDYYYHFGRYGYWLNSFYTNFNTENIKVITLEQLQKNALETLNSCFNFLELDELKSLPELQLNKAMKLKYPKLYHLVRKTLAGKYKFTKNTKSLLPKKMREQLKITSSQFVSQGNSLNYERLSLENRTWIKKLYEEDVKLLKSLVNHDFNEWADFK